MTDDLVDSLREEAHRGNKLCGEAANRLEQLDASSEGWKEIADEYFDAICERNTRIEKLEAALAHIYAWYPVSVSDPAQTIKDIKEFARKALEGKDDPQTNL